MQFEIISDITDIETIATGKSIRILPLLRKRYGAGRWRKMKGIASVRLFNGDVRPAVKYTGSKRTVLAERK